MSENFVDCTLNSLTDEQLLAAVLTKDDDGNIAIRTTFVDACEEDAVDCTINLTSLKELTRSMIGIDPVCGKPAVRLANSRAAAIQNLPEAANDAAAALLSPAVPVGGWYYKTGVGLHTRMS